MMVQTNTIIIKRVGTNGQISLGKEYAGQQIQISKLNNKTMLIKSGSFIPDDEKWLYSRKNTATLENAIQWTENNERRDNFDEIRIAIEND